MNARRREASSSRLLAASLVVVATLASTRAQADERIRKEAERRNRAASALYAEGRYESALQMYQSAYDLHPAPKFLFNIGLAKEKTFDFEGCALAFRDFLRQGEKAGEKTVRETAQVRFDTCLKKTSIPVRLTSVPTNAAVLIGEGEEEELRGRTPQQLQLPPGKHKVTVQLRGHVSQVQIIEAQVGTRPNADFVLEKLSSLHVEVDPAGARVSLGDGEWEVAPVTRELRAGVYEVRAEKPGYEPARRQVKVESGKEVSLVLPLRPLPKVRTLEVATQRPLEVESRLEVDGNVVGALPVETALSPGEHRVSVAAAGHLPYAANIRVPDERDVRLLVTLERRRSRRSRTVAWSLVGAAGAAALLGSGYGLLALSDQSEFNDDKTDVALHERGERRAERSDWCFGAATVLGAGALVYYYLTRPDPSSARFE